MNDILLAGLFGIIQGVTEFVPISSSGHLLLLHNLTSLQVTDELAFDVALHVGTLLALMVYFRNDLLRLARGLLQGGGARNEHRRLAWLLIVGAIPAALTGYLFEDFFEQTIRQPVIVAMVMILGGIALWLVDVYAKNQKNMGQLRWPASLIIGFFQVLALVPGVSRSGATIIAGRLMGLSRTEAATFSFLLAIPIIAGAGIKTAIDLIGTGFNPATFFTGMMTAGIVGYIVIGRLLRYLERGSYRVFAVYRIILGILALGYFALRTSK